MSLTYSMINIGNGSVPPSSSVGSSQIVDGSIVNADINVSAAIAATKIADGSVSNAEFQRLDGVTSAIQTQLDAKLAIAAGANYRLAASDGSGNRGNAAAITAAKALKSDANGIPTHFDTASEPSLTELTYVKGVTSAIQTQLGLKAFLPSFQNSLIVSPTTITQAYSAGAGANMAQVGSIQVTFTANANEVVVIGFLGSYGSSHATLSADLILGYIVDSGTPVVCHYGSVPGNTVLGSAQCNFVTCTTLSSGSHTIKLAASSSTANDPTINAADFTPSTFFVMRFGV